MPFEVPSDGVNRDMWGEWGQSSTAYRDADEMFLLTLGIRGRARQEPQARMTLLSPFVFAGTLCPYSPLMSRVTPSDDKTKKTVFYEPVLHCFQRSFLNRLSPTKEKKRDSPFGGKKTEK